MHQHERKLKRMLNPNAQMSKMTAQEEENTVPFSVHLMFRVCTQFFFFMLHFLFVFSVFMMSCTIRTTERMR